MDIYAFVAQKGGVGKTTLAGHLAVEAARAGPVVLVDSVCQKTSQLSESKWCVPIFEWRRFIIFGRIKVILTVYRLI